MTDLPEGAIDLLTGEPAQGQLLAELLQAGPLAPELVLRYAVSIGKALGRAHDCGLVHGSLSPWAIAIGERGAAILKPGAPDPHAPAYRSPEQIRGQAADWRSDVFAYGAVLYEIAAGRPAFAGDPGAVRTAILEEAAPKLAASSPALAAIAPVIADCLDKEPLRRRQRLQNAVVELKLAARLLVKPARVAARPGEAAGNGPRPAAAARVDEAEPADGARTAQKARRPSRKRALALAAALLMVAAASLFAGKLIFHRRSSNPVLRFPVTAEPDAGFPGEAAVSPDGRYLVYSAAGPDGHRFLWLRQMDEMHARVIPATGDAAEPFWSADSLAIGYFAGRSLKTWKVQVSDDGNPTGASRVLSATDDTAGGGTWNAAGVVVFSRSLDGGLYRVAAGGGSPEVLLPLDTAKDHRSYRWPHFLPDGRHFTFFVPGAADKTSTVYVGDLESKDTHPLFPADSDAVYAGDPNGNPAKSGNLLFVRDGDVYAQAFHPSLLTVEGKPTLFLRDVGPVATLSLAPLSVSNTGLLVYQTLGAPIRQLQWMDREGKQMGILGEPGEWGGPRIASDGKRVICGRLASDGQRAEIWLFDGDAGSRLIALPGADARSPVWAADGQRAGFTSNSGGAYDIYLKALPGPDPKEPVFRNGSSKYLTDWSRDGRYLLFNSIPPGGASSDVWAYSLAERRAGPVVETVHSEGYASLSPNGLWLAYQSDESGRDEVYVQEFAGISAGTKRRWQISTGGGRLPRWRADGGELFFLSGPGGVMSAPIMPAAGDFAYGQPVKLFETRTVPKKSNLYDVSPDGQRLLMNLPCEWSGSAVITVMTNWAQALRSP